MLITPETEHLDRRQRTRIAHTLIRLRLAAGVTHEWLGMRLNVTAEQAADLERGRNWNVLDLMAWSRANDRILTLGIGGLGVPHDGDLEALAYEAEMRKAGRGEIVDLMHLRLVHRNLARIRRAARITDEVMAGRLGISPYMVRLFDAKPAAVTLAAMQRYTRVLGGRMRPVLTNRHPRRRRRSPNPPPPTLAAANAARRTAAATRTVAQARQLLAARGFTLSAQDTLFLAARANRPEASLAELAAACGVTRDRYASRLRRLLAGHPA